MTGQTTTKSIAPVRRQIIVPVDPAVAFEIFTSEIGLWWPLGGGYSVYGEGGSVRFIDGKLVEESAGGVAVWGSVVEWAPPELLRITWHPGHEPADYTDVSVRFAAVGDGSQTLVTLEHTGWERLDNPLGYRGEYANGWSGVLGIYADRADGKADGQTGGRQSDADQDTDVWLALSHTPGVNAPEDGNVFARPEFGEHMKFVMGLLEKGLLVGAGPIEGRLGHGLTIIRVPADEATDYVRQAHDVDQSVVSGLLQVDVQSWNVRMSGLTGKPAA